MMVSDSAVARSVAEKVARESYGRLVAYLGGRSGDLASAEDALAEAFLTALEKWPVTGVPDNPDAWLLTIARRRKLDDWRKDKVREKSADHLDLMADKISAAAELDEEIPDRRLALMFACAHPNIDAASRTPLILQTVLGLTAIDISARFLVAPKTMGQRLVRAKARIKDEKIPFLVPGREELPTRLPPVLASIYAAYTNGWMDIDWAKALGHEAIWLARVVVSLLPQEPEPKGLLALMLYAEARRSSRQGPDGEFVPLDKQDVGLWDRAQLQMAEKLLREANADGPTGRYQIEAAIQSAHVARCLSGVPNWQAVVSLYDVLGKITPSPVVTLNRSVALARMGHADAALAGIHSLAGDPRMADYLPYWAARAQICADLGRHVEAMEAFTVAIGLCWSAGERRYLEEQRSRIPS
jgi:RNA polymerase sigma-70 factor (ECF subfamily)